MSEPWSQVVRVAWRPSLRFYEHRIPFMRKMEETHKLWAFQIQPDAAAGRLTRDEFFEITPRGCLIRQVGKVSADRLRKVLLAAVSEFASSDDGIIAYVALQYLEPIEADYDAATSAWAVRQFGDIFDAPSDCAMFVNGRSGDPASDYSVEYGIVNRREAVERLSRQEGTIGRLLELRYTAPGDYPYPDVALFSDWVWSEPAERAAEGIGAFWDAAVTASSEAVQNLTGLAIGADRYHVGER